MTKICESLGRNAWRQVAIILFLALTATSSKKINGTSASPKTLKKLVPLKPSPIWNEISGAKAPANAFLAAPLVGANFSSANVHHCVCVSNNGRVCEKGLFWLLRNYINVLYTRFTENVLWIIFWTFQHEMVFVFCDLVIVTGIFVT